MLRIRTILLRTIRYVLRVCTKQYYAYVLRIRTTLERSKQYQTRQWRATVRMYVTMLRNLKYIIGVYVQQRVKSISQPMSVRMCKTVYSIQCIVYDMASTI